MKHAAEVRNGAPFLIGDRQILINYPSMCPLDLDEHPIMFLAPANGAFEFPVHLGVLVNEQAFTKTANIWGVDNNAKGTNGNRIVLFEMA